MRKALWSFLSRWLPLGESWASLWQMLQAAPWVAGMLTALWTFWTWVASGITQLNSFGWGIWPVIGLAMIFPTLSAVAGAVALMRYVRGNVRGAHCQASSSAIATPASVALPAAFVPSPPNAAESTAIQLQKKPKTCDLAIATARWLYLREQNAKVDRIWSEMDVMHEMVDHLLNSVDSYSPHPEIGKALVDWTLHIKGLDWIFSEWAKEKVDLSQSAYVPSAQPTPKPNLSRDDQASYKKFYAQVTAWKSDGDFFRHKMKYEEETAREVAFARVSSIRFTSDRR